MSRALGVALVAAGPVTQAIHLPVIAGMSEDLAVVHIMDADGRLAADLAARWPGVRSSTAMEDVLADPRVEVVVVGSPDRFHAEQAIAACEAGVKAVLCEKPLAVDEAEAEAIAAASRRSGVPVLVGTMHEFDPAWRAALSRWRGLGEPARHVRSVVRLPDNDVFVQRATELIAGVPPAASSASADDELRAEILRGSLLGLHIHDVPLIRALVGDVDEVMLAEGHPPFASRVLLRCGSATVEIHGLMPGDWPPDWRLEAWSRVGELTVVQPPSYVDGGSARATVAGPQGAAESWAFADNGYRAEWRNVVECARGVAEPLASIEDAAADLGFALRVWELARERVGAAR